MPGMGDEQRKPRIGFWATVAFSIALLYPLSFGPACWLAARPDVPPGVKSGDYGPRAMIFYWPLSKLLVQDGTPGISPVLEWWIGLGVRRGYVLVLPTDTVPAGAVQIYF
jgi:hypothetical protein